MAEPRSPVPVLLVVAAFSRHDDLLERARERLEAEFGPIARKGTPYSFEQTDYYSRSMGPDLRKHLWAFAELIAPERLADIKLRTNALERELGAGFPEERPLNLDPGYLVLGKFLLATTKDQQHRIYLRDGIFAEVTLYFQGGTFHPWPWTYADYRLPEVNAFLLEARAYYREKLLADRS